MAGIGGNLTGTIQAKTAQGKNALAEVKHKWTDKVSVDGWLDMMSGDSNFSTYNAHIAESTHVFLCDYDAEVYALKDEQQSQRMIINGIVYDVKYIDNPMELNEHLEIFLKRIGAYNGE